MTLLEALSLLGDARAVGELLRDLALQLRRMRTKLRSSAAEAAINKTAEEWQAVGDMLLPRDRGTMASLGLLPIERLSRMADLFVHLDSHSVQKRRDGSAADRPLIHTRVEKTGDGLFLVRLGMSGETAALAGETVLLAHEERGTMERPTFRVTMLGSSGSGKTMFMAAMYARLRDGHPDSGIYIRALTDGVDAELGEHVRRMIEAKQWPAGTTDAELRYAFELGIQGRPIAKIDWVDYRGGALREKYTDEAGRALAERLMSSHAIIWMVDMTKLKAGPVNTMAQRIRTDVGRMAAMCRELITNHNQPRVWMFVRTKADTVRASDGGLDFKAAAREFVEHLGPARLVANTGPYARAAAVAVSASGPVASDGAPVGEDDPFHVEWPLLLSLGFLLDAEIARLRSARTTAGHRLAVATPGVLGALLREIFDASPTPEEVAAGERLSAISQQLVHLQHALGRVLRGCPEAVLPITF